MTDKRKDKQIMLAYALVGVLLLFLFLLGIILPDDSRVVFMEEGGVVETATVFGYFLCAVLIIYKRKLVDLKHFFLMIIFFMLRELDFDKRFTTMGIFKSRFFSSPKVPLVEKVIGIIVILFLIYISISIVYRYGKQFFLGLKKRSPVSFGVLLAISLLVISKSLDGFARKLKEFGIIVSEQMSMHAGTIEEILELGIPLFIFLTLTAYFQDTDNLTNRCGTGR